MPEETLTAADWSKLITMLLWIQSTLINDLMALSSRDDDQTATVTRNVEHLEIMVAKTYWTSDHDLAPLNAAITAGTPS